MCLQGYFLETEIQNFIEENVIELDRKNQNDLDFIHEADFFPINRSPTLQYQIDDWKNKIVKITNTRIEKKNGIGICDTKVRLEKHTREDGYEYFLCIVFLVIVINN